MKIKFIVIIFNLQIDEIINFNLFINILAFKMCFIIQ